MFFCSGWKVVGIVKVESQVEKNKIHQENVSTIDLMEIGIEFFDDDSGCCSRGLESHTQKGFQHKLDNRMKAWIAVFDEQDHQKSKGILDPKKISQAYMKSTESCHIRASIIGLSDERSVYSSSSNNSLVLSRAASSSFNKQTIHVQQVSSTERLVERQ